MLYEQALSYLHSLQRFGMKPGLERTRELLRRLGRPDWRAGRIIHITGTSGKGSVAAMVEAGLRAAGHHVGMYTSPSLERFTDRIQVNREEIAPAELAALVAEVKPQVEAMVAEGLEQPTEFEVTTAVAFLYFANRQVDWLVLEVGLGGRFDATTAIDNPVATCITNIGLDHTDWLGKTHEAIARDKAGIIKPAVPCVTGTEHEGALEVIREIALEQNSVLMEVTDQDYRVTRVSAAGQMVDLLGARGWYWDLTLALLGRHQAANAALAVRLLELAGVSEAHIRQGLATVALPGRFEVRELPGGVTLVLDAAHNPAKCEALAEAVRAYFPSRAVTLVLGVLADKNVTEMVRPLLSLAETVWVTTPESPRRLEASDLAAVCAGLGRPVRIEPSVPRAVAEALESCREGQVVLITGSFYTVGPARRHLLVQMDENM